MLYKIRSNPVHPLNGALHGPYVPVWVTRGAFGYTYAPYIGTLMHRLAAEPRAVQQDFYSPLGVSRCHSLSAVH